MRTERDACAQPMRRRFRHFSGMAHRGQPAEIRRCVVQPVAHFIKSRIAAVHVVDAAEPAQPVAGLR